MTTDKQVISSYKQQQQLSIIVGGATFNKTMDDYVTVSNGEEGEAALTVELPTEEDGTLLLSVLQSQFEGATGLKYK